MNEYYDHKDIESFAQKAWEEKNSFYVSDDSDKLNITVYQCSHTPQGNTYGACKKLHHW